MTKHELALKLLEEEDMEIVDNSLLVSVRASFLPHELKELGQMRLNTFIEEKIKAETPPTFSEWYKKRYDTK
jgi:hypothetical protein